MELIQRCGQVYLYCPTLGRRTLVYVLIDVKSADALHSLPAERSRGSNQ
jgi:hypothetical protein